MCELGRKWAGPGSRAEGAGREGQLGVEGRVESRPRKDIQGQLGVGEDFQQGWRKWICLLNTMCRWDYWGPS